MDALALFAIPFFMTMAAHEASVAQYRYAAAAQDRPSYVYAVPPGSGWAPGSVIGAGVGGIAGGPGGAVAGAMLGGTLGYAATVPPAYVAPAYTAPVAHTPPARATLAWNASPRPASADGFIGNWQSFMQPSAGR
jgi:hypothetical protein